jgi:hypothetical protein
LWWLLFGGEGRQYRMLALLWVVPFLIFFVQGGSRSDYLTPACLPLLAAGAVVVSRWRPFARTRWLPVTTMGDRVLGVGFSLSQCRYCAVQRITCGLSA